MNALFFLAQEHAAAAAEAAHEAFNAGELIIGHVSNSSLEHPLIHLPTLAGIDFSVTKHVFMLWLVAGLLFVSITTLVRRYVRQPTLVPAGAMNLLELTVEFVQDGIVTPAVGRKWTATWTPLLLTVFLFILGSNVIGLIPIFDVLGLINHVLHVSPDSFMGKVVHGGTTATGNFNVTAGLAMVTFFAIIVAGTMAHGFVQHWKNLVPHGVPLWLYPLLIPLEFISMLVRPFALTMRLAANMSGGHIAILAILSLIFVFAEMMQTSVAGIGIGFAFSLPLGVAISALELIVVLVQAYVFTLLSAVFIGMAIHAHH